MTGSPHGIWIWWNREYQKEERTVDEEEEWINSAQNYCARDTIVSYVHAANISQQSCWQITELIAS